jgi:hypothetical protein
MKRKWLVVAGTLGVLAVLFFVVGPLIITRIISNTAVPIQESAPIKIKASGTVSLAGDYLILTTPQGKNNYILAGNRQNELKQFADKKNIIFVVGNLMTPKPKTVGNMAIRYRIEVTEFDTKDFEVGQKMTPQVADALRQKVAEKAAFREATLKKLGLNKNLDVISGKVFVLQNCFYTDNPKENLALLLVDKYNDQYLLYDFEKVWRPYDKFKKYDNNFIPNLTVVVVGEVSLPDPSVTLPATIKYVPFAAQKMYNSDLRKFNADELVARK